MSERLRALRADLDLWLGDARHDFARDFGWPTRLSLSALRLAYERNALAAAAINKITAKTWREDPQLVFGDGVAEAGFAALADRTRLFARLAQADAPTQVGFIACQEGGNFAAFARSSHASKPTWAWWAGGSLAPSAAPILPPMPTRWQQRLPPSRPPS